MHTYRNVMHTCIRYIYIPFLRLIVKDPFNLFSCTEHYFSNKCVCVKKQFKIIQINKYVPIPNQHRTGNIILLNTNCAEALFMYADWHLHILENIDCDHTYPSTIITRTVR